MQELKLYEAGAVLMKNNPGLIDDAFPFIERMDGAPAVTYTRVFMKT